MGNRLERITTGVGWTEVKATIKTKAGKKRRETGVCQK